MGPLSLAVPASQLPESLFRFPAPVVSDCSVCARARTGREVGQGREAKHWLPLLFRGRELPLDTLLWLADRCG